MYIARLIATLLILGMAACGGPPPPTKFALSIVASPELNVNSDKQPSPVVVRVYDLKSTDAFLGATFFDLFDNDTAKLGGDLLGRKELMMQPGMTVKLDRESSPDTRFIAVLAGFRVIGESGWRAWMRVDPGSSNSVVISLDPNTVRIAPAKSRFLGIF
jgi:type VI secretion system protein VasD